MEENIIKQFIENLEHSNLSTDDLILILSKVQGYVETRHLKNKEALEKDKLYIKEEQEKVDKVEALLGRTPVKENRLCINGVYLGGVEYPWNNYPTSPTVCQPCGTLSNTNSTQ